MISIGAIKINIEPRCKEHMEEEISRWSQEKEVWRGQDKEAAL